MMQYLVVLKLKPGDCVGGATREENSCGSRGTGKPVAVDLHIGVRTAAHVKRTCVGDQIVIQDAGIAPWIIERKGPRCTRYDIVQNHCIVGRTRRRANGVDSERAVDRESVDRDILRVRREEG